MDERAVTVRELRDVVNSLENAMDVLVDVIDPRLAHYDRYAKHMQIVHNKLVSLTQR